MSSIMYIWFTYYVGGATVGGAVRAYLSGSLGTIQWQSIRSCTLSRHWHQLVAQYWLDNLGVTEFASRKWKYSRHDSGEEEVIAHQDAESDEAVPCDCLIRVIAIFSMSISTSIVAMHQSIIRRRTRHVLDIWSSLTFWHWDMSMIYTEWTKAVSWFSQCFKPKFLSLTICK